MSCKLYVQSAGTSQDQDYFWKAIQENGQQRTNEPAPVAKFKHLLQTDSFSVLVGWHSEEWVLYITGMKSVSRRDYRNRIIRNSALWVCSNIEEDQFTIRKIVASALCGEFEEGFNESITDDESGFNVSISKIKEVIDSIGVSLRDDPPPKQNYLGKNSAKNREKVAGMVSDYSLPKPKRESEAIVIVTEVKSEEALKKEGVWLGLSSLVKDDELSPYKLSPYKLSPYKEEFFRKVPVKESGGRHSQVFFTKLVILLIGLVVLLSLLSFISSFLNSNLSSSTNRGHNVTTLSAVFASTDDKYTVVAREADNSLVVASSKFVTEVDEEKQILQVSVKHSPVSSVAVSSDGKTIVSGHANGSIKVWDVNEGLTEVNSVSCHEGEVLSIDISSDGRTMVSGGEDGQVKFLTIEDPGNPMECIGGSFFDRS